MQALGLEADQLVTVRGEAGALHGIRARVFPAIRSGNALMYFPEANVLLPRHTDPVSKTPAFKGAMIQLQADPIDPAARAPCAQRA